MGRRTRQHKMKGLEECIECRHRFNSKVRFGCILKQPHRNIEVVVVSFGLVGALKNMIAPVASSTKDLYEFYKDMRCMEFVKEKLIRSKDWLGPWEGRFQFKDVVKKQLSKIYNIDNKYF